MKIILPATVLVAALAVAPAFACASCGCTLTADWLSQGLVAQPGTTVALRYDYIPQTQLRSGHDALDRSAITLPSDREIERYTYNHYLTASIDRQFNSDWGVDVQLPILTRPHATVGEEETEQSTSRTNGIGDARVTVRWQGFSTPGAITGVQFGLVLPTGRFHQTFRSGPEAGEEVDRGLQPGTGTTQLLAGLYRYGRLAPDVDYILQAEAQLPLNSRDLYRPGTIGQASAGLHYTRWRGITPQLQINFRASAKDHGENADRANSGGEQLYVAPGLIAKVTARASAFGYVQLPVYQRLNGYQLAPRATVSAGLQYRL